MPPLPNRPATALPSSPIPIRKAPQRTGSTSARRPASTRRAIPPSPSPICRAGFRPSSEAGASYLFIDTAPSIGAVNADLFALADLILIPLNPTPADLRALVKGLPLVRESGKPFQFVLTRVRPNLRNNDGAAVALDALGLVLATRMHERVIYAETFAHGKTALETDAKGVAAQEVAALWAEIRKKMERRKRIHESENSMSKRPAIDLAALTSEAAAPMTEASQRAARPRRTSAAAPPPASAAGRACHQDRQSAGARVQSVAGVPQTLPQRAANADLKLNELLFEALDAWEEKRGIKR